jgi:hypothetical protein
VGRPPSTIRAGAWAARPPLARTAAIARTAGDEDTEGGWHHIEAFGYILADLVERAAAARAGPNAINFLDIDDLLDPFEMGWAFPNPALSVEGCSGCRSSRRPIGAGRLAAAPLAAPAQRSIRWLASPAPALRCPQAGFFRRCPPAAIPGARLDLRRTRWQGGQ